MLRVYYEGNVGRRYTRQMGYFCVFYEVVGLIGVVEVLAVMCEPGRWVNSHNDAFHSVSPFCIQSVGGVSLWNLIAGA